MLAASLPALVLIASSLVFVSFLCGRRKPRNGSLKLDDSSEITRRETSGSEVRVEVIELNCNSAFQSLTANQQKHAHYSTKAFFDATLSAYFQISTEAAGVFIMLYRLFAFESMDRLRAIAEACDFTEDEWNNFIVWSALRLSRYSSGLSYAKLVGPRVDEMKFKNLIANSEGAAEFPGTRRLYVSIFIDIFNSYLVPYNEKISANIREFVQNTNRKLGISLKTAKLSSLGSGGCIDPKFKINSIFYYFYPPGQPEYSQGFVGICNTETTKTFSRLTNNVKRILKKLPWGKDYEKNKVGNPKLTSFDLMAYAFHELLEGVNLAREGESDLMKCCLVFRNLISMEPNKATLKEEDLLLFEEYKRRAGEMQTALHELFGHGTGKLFTRSSKGRFNFNKNETVDVLTGGRVTSWYEPGETYKSVFGDLADTFEECKADAVGYVLSCDAEVLELFGYTGDSAENIKYANCLRMADIGLNGLLDYKVATKNWDSKSPHSWARFVLLKVCVEAGEGYLTIEQTKDSNGDGLLIHLDRTKIDSVGVPAVRAFLKKLQALKSTADVKGARALFDRYSVGPTEVEWKWIMNEKATGHPKVLLQPNTVMNADGSVELKRYPVSAEGVIQSVIERYTIETIDEFEKLWRVEMETSAIVGYVKEAFPNDTAETRYNEPID